LAAVSLLGRAGFVLTAISDLTGTALWRIAMATMLWAAFSNQPNGAAVMVELPAKTKIDYGQLDKAC